MFTPSTGIQELVAPSKKKRVTAGEVDKLGKELGNCTHQWTTNDDTNTQALSTLSLHNRHRRKKEAEKRTDEKEATKLNQRNFNKEYVILSSSLLLSSFCCCLSFFF